MLYFPYLVVVTERSHFESNQCVVDKNVFVNKTNLLRTYLLDKILILVLI